MSDNNSGGLVELELQIQNTVARQMEKIGGEASRSAQKSFKNTESIIDQSVNKPLEKTRELYAEWGRVSKSFSKLSGKKFDTPKIEIEHFKVANDAITLAEQKIDNIAAQMGIVEKKLSQTEKLYNKISAEKGFDSSEAKELKNELNALRSKLIGLQSTAMSTEDKLKKAVEAPQKAAAKAYDDIVKKAQYAAKQAEKWAVKSEKARSKSASRAARHAERAYNKQLSACKIYASKYADAQADASDKAQKAANTAYKKMNNAAARAEEKARKASQKTARDTAKHAGSMGNAFGKMGKAVMHSLKAVFVTAVLYKFFNAFKKGIAGAVSQNKEFSKSLNAVKANLSVAFTPIIEAVMPLITRLASGLATVTKYIASFIAAIFGKTYKQAVDSTKKLQGQAQEAEAAERSSSRDFDELHNVEDNQSGGSGGSSGVDLDALDTSSLNTGPMQKFQEILDKVKNTVKEITPSFKNLYEKGIKPVAEWVGGKLKDAFHFLGQQLEKVGNWLVEHKESFSKLGDSIGRLWNYLQPILDAAWEILKTTLGGVFDSFLTGIGTAIDILPSVLDLITSLFTGDWEGIKEAGKDIIAGLWKGIKDSWEDTKKQISGIWEGLIKTVKAIFGIHSPSTVLADVGKNIILGLKEGVTEQWERFKSFVSEKLEGFKNTVEEKLGQAKEKALEIFGNLRTGITDKYEEMKNGLTEFKNNIAEGWENLNSNVREKLEEYKNSVHEKFTDAKETALEIFTNLKDGAGEIWDNLVSGAKEKLDTFKSTVGEKFDSVKEKVLGAVDKLKSGIKERGNSIYEGFKEFINKILSGTEKLINKPVDALNKFIRKLNALHIKLPDVLGGGNIGFNIGEFSKVSIPQLAKGGIVNKPTLSLIGEAGKEAVVPLQNNTEWMDKLKEIIVNAVLLAFGTVGSNKTQETSSRPRQINFQLDGRTFASIVLDLIDEYGGSKNVDLGVII